MSILTPGQLSRVRRFMEGGMVGLDNFVLDNPAYAQMVTDFRNAGMDESQIVGMLQDAGKNVTSEFVGGQNNAGGNVRTADFQDSNMNGIDDRDEGQAGGGETTGGGGTSGGGTTTRGGGTTTGGGDTTTTQPYVSRVTTHETRTHPTPQKTRCDLTARGSSFPV